MTETYQRPIDRLIAIMARLRAPVGGCPWDLEQNFATIAPYTIEEAYEVADAIERNDKPGLREELGDLLLQVVYHARMAEEEGSFAFDDVATAISDKMVARHPHVFGDKEVAGAAGQTRMWEEFKARERAAKAKASGKPQSVLDDVPLALPALMRAEKLQKRAARVGFDWPDVRQVLDKLEEEIAELRAEIDQGGKPERVADEVGDLLFVLANLARHLKVDPETALRGCNAKFERRFNFIEQSLAAQGRAPKDATLEEMEALWLRAKLQERERS
ncbi:MAG: nucleoside triphosphate pyrophosphohydrolase [Rhodospirillales bacterium]|nr:nucleoside triphosphate pyrophosphohydrolase [Rhodospirillales bacterium]